MQEFGCFCLFQWIWICCNWKIWKGKESNVQYMYSVYELCWLSETGTRSETFSVRGQETWSNCSEIHVKSNDCQPIFSIFIFYFWTCLIKLMIIEKYNDFFYAFKLLKVGFEYVFDECLNHPFYMNDPLLIIKGLCVGYCFLDQLTSTHPVQHFIYVAWFFYMY